MHYLLIYHSLVGRLHRFLKKTPNSASGHKMCGETTHGPVFFRFVTFRIIMEICDFCLEISLKNIENFQGLSVGTLSNFTQ